MNQMSFSNYMKNKILIQTAVKRLKMHVAI